MEKFEDYFLDTLKNRYADFSGRARRSEYWYFALFNVLVTFAFYSFIIVGVISDMGFFTGIGGILLFIYMMGIIVPSLAVAVRGLHDTGKSGWTYLLGFIPIIGTIILLVFFVTDGEPGENKWGPNPKETEPI